MFSQEISKTQFMAISGVSVAVFGGPASICARFECSKVKSVRFDFVSSHQNFGYAVQILEFFPGPFKFGKSYKIISGLNVKFSPGSPKLCADQVSPLELGGWST